MEESGVVPDRGGFRGVSLHYLLRFPRSRISEDLQRLELGSRKSFRAASCRSRADAYGARRRETLACKDHDATAQGGWVWDVGNGEVARDRTGGLLTG